MVSEFVLSLSKILVEVLLGFVKEKSVMELLSLVITMSAVASDTELSTVFPSPDAFVVLTTALKVPMSEYLYFTVAFPSTKLEELIKMPGLPSPSGNKAIPWAETWVIVKVNSVIPDKPEVLSTVREDFEGLDGSS